VICPDVVVGPERVRVTASRAAFNWAVLPLRLKVDTPDALKLETCVAPLELRAALEIARDPCRLERISEASVCEAYISPDIV
jgi:hypothetical protein